MVLSSYIHSRAPSIKVTFIRTMIDEMPVIITHTHNKNSTLTSADNTF